MLQGTISEVIIKGFLLSAWQLSPPASTKPRVSSVTPKSTMAHGARAAVRHYAGSTDSSGPAPVYLIGWSGSMRTSPQWLTSTSHLVCMGRSCFSSWVPQIPANNVPFLVELLSSRRHWIKYVFNEDTCLTRTPCRTMWWDKEAECAKSIVWAGTFHRHFCGTALRSTCWRESGCRIMLKKNQQKQKSSFQNPTDLRSYFSTNN